MSMTFWKKLRAKFATAAAFTDEPRGVRPRSSGTFDDQNVKRNVDVALKLVCLPEIER